LLWVSPIATLLLVVGCPADPESLREWRPEDHSRPELGAPQQSAAGEMSDEERIALLWAEACASCHGTEGRGDGPGRTTEAPLRDLTTAEWQDSVSDEEIRAIIAEGRGAMPGFRTQYNARGIDLLVGHVRQMRAP
jgi:mono/diheme cytochrome c family protein